MKQTAIRVVITGRVQGVFFRAFVAREAERLGLRGFVRNRRDGSVEALFRGEEAAIAAMLGKCHTGPPAAQVARVETTKAHGIVPDRFEIKPTV
ncbi:MAG: acylphosphatase [Rhodothalassiaceae bacterium]